MCCHPYTSTCSSSLAGSATGSSTEGVQREAACRVTTGTASPSLTGRSGGGSHARDPPFGSGDDQMDLRSSELRVVLAITKHLGEAVNNILCNSVPRPYWASMVVRDYERVAHRRSAGRLKAVTGFASMYYSALALTAEELGTAIYDASEKAGALPVELLPKQPGLEPGSPVLWHCRSRAGWVPNQMPPRNSTPLQTATAHLQP